MPARMASGLPELELAGLSLELEFGFAEELELAGLSLELDSGFTEELLKSSFLC